MLNSTHASLTRLPLGPLLPYPPLTACEGLTVSEDDEATKYTIQNL